jgi:hypothetical protein
MMDNNQTVPVANVIMLGDNQTLPYADGYTGDPFVHKMLIAGVAMSGFGCLCGLLSCCVMGFK